MSSPVKVLLVQPGERQWDLDGNSFQQAASWLDLMERGTSGPAEAAAPNIWTWSHGERATKSVHTAAAVRQGRKTLHTRVENADCDVTYGAGLKRKLPKKTACNYQYNYQPPYSSVQSCLYYNTSGWRQIAITSLIAPPI